VKKVLFVATVVKTHIMEFHIPYLKMFKERGWNTAVASRNDYENAEDCQIPFCDDYYNVPFERSPIKLSNFQAYKELKKLINNGDYDIIHCHTPVGAMLARLAARRARKRGTKVIYTAHGFHFYKGAPIINWLLYYPVERFLARYTDVLITINKEDYERAKKFRARKVCYVRGVGVNVAKFEPNETNKKEIRDELAIKNSDVVVLSVGEVNKNKNHRTVIEAIAKSHSANLYYVICGQGPLVDEHKNLAKLLGVEDRVIFAGYRTDVSKFYSMADVFVFPSFREGLSVALMEAMSCGLPIVCSNIRGNVDLVQDGAGGYLCDPSDAAGFSVAIERLANDAELRRNMGRTNIENVKEFDISSVMDQMLQIYKNEFEET